MVEIKLKSGELQKVGSVLELYDCILDMYGQVPAFKGKLIETLMYLTLTQKGITIKEFIQLTKFSEDDWYIFETIFRPVIVKYDKIYSIKSSGFSKRVRDKEPKLETKLVKYHEKIS